MIGKTNAQITGSGGIALSDLVLFVVHKAATGVYTAYCAEKGMTWGDFVNSEYNTGNFSINSNNGVSEGSFPIKSLTTGTNVKSSDVISSLTYEIAKTGSGGSN